MTVGWDEPLYLLAFDHRRPHLAKLFGVTGDPTPDQAAIIVDAKSVIFDGFAAALADGAPAGAGILVDEQFGAAVARAALAGGWTCAMPVERSGIGHFDFEYGDDFGSHIDDFAPTFAKVLVRYNPDGDASSNRTSIANLQRLSAWLRTRAPKLLLELIIPAEPSQRERVDGDDTRYVTEVRPGLMRRAISELQSAGIEADVWKIEGINRRDDCVMVAEQARAGGRQRVGCVVLGQGASTETVEHWLRTAAGVPGYLGFAIGRTLWWEQISGYLDGSLAREDAAREIAAHYRRAIDTYRGA